MARSEIVEWLVLLTLWVEFWYDVYWNSRENRKKRRAKKLPDFDRLNQGEGK